MKKRTRWIAMLLTGAMLMAPMNVFAAETETEAQTESQTESQTEASAFPFTLVTKDDASGSSYIPRMKTINPDIPADAFICQLSTNDATRHMPLGTISGGFELADFDTETVAGAIEYIIAYAEKTWHCPVLFYTGTRFDCEEYGEMVRLLLGIQKNWKIGVIDLWNDKALHAISEKDYNLYMSNPIHPTQAGYLLWWTPAMETYLYEFLK